VRRDALVAAFALLAGVAAGLAYSGGRGRAAEIAVVGAGCIGAYIASWSLRWVVPAAVAVVTAALEEHDGRLTHARYWHEAVLLAAVISATYAAALAGRFAAARELRGDTAIDELNALETRDVIDEALGLAARAPYSLVYELERARRHNHVLSVLLVRADDLDEVAHRYGEAAGADLLGVVATVIGRVLRATDIPVRFGQSDIAVILPETDRAGARIVAERIRLSSAEERLQLQPGEVVDVTVSVGSASFPQDAMTNEALADVLHEALDAAVAAGGDRTMLYSVPNDSPAGWGLSRTT
jgi:diguanylate cyclase (GGDEF)-like protein